MLKKILAIDGLGLLHSSGTSPGFHQCTLLFAENGRGKSTFTALLESLRSGDMSELARLQTIDQSTSVQAKLHFDNGPSTSEIVSGNWDHLRPKIRVFDSRFVRENVYSGSLVDPSHRRNLLSFVLGGSAVAESSRERRATEDLASATSDVRAKENALSPMLNGATINEFIAFTEDEDITAKIAKADKNIENHESVAEILAKPVPIEVGLLEPKLDAVFDLLARGLEEVQDTAATLVEQHLAAHMQPGFETWLRDGAAFESDEECPYCRQSIAGNKLIGAYRQFFSQQYFDHVTQITNLFDLISESVGPDAVQDLTRRLASEVKLTNWWKERSSFEELVIDVTDVQTHFSTIWSLISGAVAQKLAAPLTKLVVPEIQERVAELWAQIKDSLASFNGIIVRNSTAIGDLKTGLSAGDLPALQIVRGRLEAQRVRHTPGVSAIVTGLVDSRANVVRHETDRGEARSNVRALMDGTLSRYQSKINELLVSFGAGFSVKEMRTNFRGPSPQSEYVILLRSREVPLTAETGPNFDTALSEGDKRTLAFAFFVASVLDDPDAAALIIAVDDPMSSMDAGRRRITIATLIKLQRVSSQLLLSSHDSVFLRDYRNELTRMMSAIPVAEIQLLGGFGTYSSWAEASLDDLSESARKRTLRTVEIFVNSGQGDLQLVAANIRPMLEGYLHSRFPTHLKDGLILGDCITAIRQSVSPSPLVFAQNIADKIESINSYAGTFHHDGSAGYIRPVANSGEVQNYAKQALDLIYSGNAST